MTSFKTKISEGGRLVIPATYRKRLGIKPGDHVFLVLDEGELRVLTPHRAIQRAQALVRRYVPRGKRLSDELIRDRRQEAGRG